MEQILQHAAGAFLAHNSPLQIYPLGHGHIHKTYQVISGDKQTQSIVLQQFNTNVFKNPEAVAHNILKVANHFEKYFPEEKFLHPVTTQSGSTYFIDPTQNYWRAFRYIPSTVTFENATSPGLAEKAAQKFGWFTEKLLALNPLEIRCVIPDFHNLLFRMAQLEEAAKNNPRQRAEANVQMINDILAMKPFARQFTHLQQHVPPRITHNDTKINNLLFEENTMLAACVIDLDTLMTQTLFSDFGDMVRTYTSPVEEDEKEITEVVARAEYFEALASGYLKAVKSFITQKEKNNLFTGGLAITLMQAIRFLTDYLNGDCYYPVQYPEHNLIRSKNQYALFLDLKKKASLFSGICKKL
ncbi:MAG: aminoglycoside phosphotransferase family protein [Bacteroidia bacterium]|nr:aminoglycoside phosphotransferase family protein [Bacteroidia bacterium]